MELKVDKPAVIQRDFSEKMGLSIRTPSRRGADLGFIFRGDFAD